MDPITMAVLGSTVYSTIDGMNTARQNNANQTAIAQAQLDQASGDSLLRNYYASQADADAKLGTTNSRGDRTYFIPGVGYVTDLSDMGEALQDSSDTEMLRRSTQDSALARELTQRGFRRQLDEGDYAANLLQELKRGPTITADQLESMLREQGRRDVGESYDKATNNVSRTALRTGANMGDALKKIIAERGKTMGNIGKDAKMQALNMFDTMEGNRVNRNGSLYNTFATRASGVPNTQFQPFDVAGASDASGMMNQRGAIARQQIGSQNTDLSGIKLPSMNDAMAASDIGNAGFESLMQIYKNRQTGNAKTGGK